MKIKSNATDTVFMKNILFISILMAFSACQHKNEVSIPMCHDPKAVFASFGNDADFRNAHPSPAPISYEGNGQMIRFAVPGGDSAWAYRVNAPAPTDKYLLLFHEYWGLNDYIKREADMWASELNVNVLALDLYDGKVATKSEDAVKLMQSNDAHRSEAIITASAAYAGPKADFRTMGWCFGGGWSLKAGLLMKDRLKACVMYYGMPEKDVEVLKSLGSDVVFIHPMKDKWITAEVAKDFESNMEKAGKKVMVYHYDADHAFANPSSPRYNESAAQEARAVVSKYLRDK